MDDTEDYRKPCFKSRNTQGWIAIWGCLFLLIIPGALPLVIVIYAIYHAIYGFGSRNWPFVKGIIRISYLAKPGDGNTGQVLCYEYVVDGVTYYNSRTDFGKPTSLDEVWDEIKKYPQGEELEVYYHPKKPKRSTVITRYQPQKLLVLIFVPLMAFFQWIGIVVFNIISSNLIKSNLCVTDFILGIFNYVTKMANYRLLFWLMVILTLGSLFLAVGSNTDPGKDGTVSDNMNDLFDYEVAVTNTRDGSDVEIYVLVRITKNSDPFSAHILEYVDIELGDDLEIWNVNSGQGGVSDYRFRENDVAYYVKQLQVTFHYASDFVVRGETKTKTVSIWIKNFENPSIIYGLVVLSFSLAMVSFRMNRSSSTTEQTGSILPTSLSRERNFHLKRQLTQKYPHRKEIYQITRETFGATGKSALGILFIIPFVLIPIGMLYAFLTFFSPLTSDMGIGGVFLSLFVVLFLGFFLFIVFRGLIGPFVLRYNGIETFYIDDGQLVSEKIVLGKVSQKGYQISTISSIKKDKNVSHYTDDDDDGFSSSTTYVSYNLQLLTVKDQYGGRKTINLMTSNEEYVIDDILTEMSKFDLPVAGMVRGGDREIEVQEAKGHYSCNSCNAEITSDTVFCPECGSKVS